MTEHDPVADKVHVVELNEPPVVPATRLKVTVPVATLDAFVVSTTVAVHVEVWPVRIALGAHARVVEVLSGTGKLTVIVAETVVWLGL